MPPEPDPTSAPPTDDVAHLVDALLDSAWQYEEACRHGDSTETRNELRERMMRWRHAVLSRLASLPEDRRDRDDAERYRALRFYLRSALQWDEQWCQHVLRCGRYTLMTGALETGWSDQIVDAAADYARRLGKPNDDGEDPRGPILRNRPVRAARPSEETR